MIPNAWHFQFKVGFRVYGDMVCFRGSVAHTLMRRYTTFKLGVVDVIDTYQTLIAGVVGFVGVIISILANGFFARKQHGQGIAQRRKSIISAIKAELNVNLTSFEGRAEILKIPSNGKRTAFPVKVFNDVYKEMLGQIGYLTEEECRCIINIYLLLEEFPNRVKLLLSDSEYSIDDFIVITDPSHRCSL
ncbi:TPA: hypothetical protein NJ448_004567 [Vibrio parahaemolyticus]|nr:hypothetical protein [Vibrio parahaemolyticus]EIV8646618.1 hypothetical protein [Vibrio parahaemolyticus]EIV8675572.1 hypothetical protein [Vibrio parahaemolyticus]ELA6986374.1 hypothetical protein [Vibrio parahaemolyticus]MBE4094533.1 hypothetical protein [Vibrio parahaemolyticus]MBE4286771.1 hypothetical protein [Vibrio parahaemolyticus]